jgi:predicted DNA-binding transcriptional regulator AlpA
LSDILLRFRDLKARGIILNYPTLTRWIRDRGFPPGFRLGPNTRVWRESDVTRWLDSLPSALDEKSRLRGAARMNAERSAA